MTVREVAALLRVSPQTLYKMLEQGSIPAVKIGSQWRFDREQIRRRLDDADLRRIAPLTRAVATHRVLT